MRQFAIAVTNRLDIRIVKELSILSSFELEASKACLTVGVQHAGDVEILLGYIESRV